MIPEGPRFFGRRRGKALRVTGRTLVETLLPRLAIDEPGPGTVLDPASLFSTPPAEVWLEVGFGGGEHLAWQALHNPEVGLIGGEVFLNGIASLLGHVDRDGIGNIRVFPEDVRRLFPALPDASLARVFVLFPDPWPKKRHAERRFIGGGNLDQLSRLMRDGGELRIATDDETYKQWAVDRMAERPDFENITADPARKVEDWPATRYETKAREQGRSPVFLRYRRRPRAWQ
ncbi:MAG: tRNA (guanosine(46)-N7)-methyltransferase TrmB [Telmatospirillum sp.]|nr:tRNA (guanosine(46)-N7)-methyltransferase TrmB [Telmatospirillum sp.]